MRGHSGYARDARIYKCGDDSGRDARDGSSPANVKLWRFFCFDLFDIARSCAERLQAQAAIRLKT